MDENRSSGASTQLSRLDETEHLFSLIGGVDRPSQKQVRTRGRKRAPPTATDYPPPKGQTTCLCQKGSDPPRASRKNGSDLETSPIHRPARDAPALASPGV